MKILHWNIHGWTDADGVDNVDRVIDLVREVDPDVISFVEVDEEWGNPSKLRRVAETLGYCWTFVPAFEYREEGGFGNALLSKTPFQSVEQWQLLPPDLYDGTEPSEPRAVLIAEVPVTKGSVAVGSTHFPRKSEQLREIASRRLLEALEGDRRLVVAGDFNRPASEWLDGKQVDQTSGLDTYPAKNPAERIDYLIFGNIPKADLAVLSSFASDHLPVVSDLTA